MKTNAKDKLGEVIERLYLTFADYPLVWWDGPYCCTSREDEVILHSKPLRELTASELYLTEWHMFICGRQDIEGYKYLLPRSLELLANEESFTYPEVIMGHLRMAGWLDWPVNEKEVLLGYMTAVWQVILSDVAYEINSEYWLVCLAIAGVPLSTFLEILRDDQSAEAAGRLAEIIIWNSDELVNGELFNPYWEDHRKEMSEVVDWILSRQTVEKLQLSRYKGLSREFLDYIENANEYLRRFTLHD